jgi:ABC-type transport system substrate-binding protein
VLDARLTNSVGLFQIYSLTGNRMVRYLYSDEASSPTDLTLKVDLAESWEGNSDYRVWTFKLKRGVKWHNMPPVNGRELVAADIKYCFEAYAKEGVQAFTFGEIAGELTGRCHDRRREA